MTGAHQRTRSASVGKKNFSQILVLVTLIGIGCWVVWARWSLSSPQSSSKSKETSTVEHDLMFEILPQLNFSNPDCHSSRSQHKEDIRLFLRFWAFPEVKKDGVFLEIGALDGILLSNSYWYERCLGWTGVLIEGHPTAAKALRKNRPNVISFEAAACEKDEGNITFVGAANGVSGDIGQMPGFFIKKYHAAFSDGNEEVHVVQCRRISSMLREAGVEHIDFWTLDVEGAEFTVLSTFNWEKIPVHVLVVENDKEKSVQYERRHVFLTSKGMKYLGPLYNNELWANPNYPDIILPLSADQG